MYRTDRRGAVHGACSRTARLASRKGRRAPERQYPQERHGRWDPRYGDDRPADRRGARGARRPFGVPAGGIARRDARGRGAGPPVYRRKARMYRPEAGYRRETLYRGRGPGRRALCHGGDRGRPYLVRIPRARRRGDARQTYGLGGRRGWGRSTPHAAPRVGVRHDGAPRRTALHPRNTPPEQGRRRAGFRRGVRPLLRAYAPLRARTEDYGRQHLLADTVLYLRGVRRPHGRGDDPRDE